MIVAIKGSEHCFCSFGRARTVDLGPYKQGLITSPSLKYLKIWGLNRHVTLFGVDLDFGTAISRPSSA